MARQQIVFLWPDEAVDPCPLQAGVFGICARGERLAESGDDVRNCRNRIAAWARFILVTFAERLHMSITGAGLRHCSGQTIRRTPPAGLGTIPVPTNQIGRLRNQVA